MVIATLPSSLFDLYFLMVDVIFGSIFLSGVAMAFIIFVICMLGRVSLMTSLFWIIIYIIVFGSFYLEAAALLLGFLVGFLYFMDGLIRLFIPSDY